MSNSEYERGFAAGFERGFKAGREGMVPATYEATAWPPIDPVISGTTTWKMPPGMLVTYGMSENGNG